MRQKIRLLSNILFMLFSRILCGGCEGELGDIEELPIGRGGGGCGELTIPPPLPSPLEGVVNHIFS